MPELSGVTSNSKQVMFIFTSSDEWSFEPFEVAALPFSAGSQSVVYYDDPRQPYVAHQS